MAKPPNHTTNREVGVLINNAVLASMTTKRAKDEEADNPVKAERRRRKLRHCSVAIIKPVMENIDSGHFHAEEGVAMLLAGALTIHAMRVPGSTGIKLPAFQDWASRYLHDEGLSDEQV